MHVKIHTGACSDGTSPISNSALECVRGESSPSGDAAVDRVKALTAALITEMEAARSDGIGNAREAAIAITQFQGACMFAVAALTADA